MASIVPSLLAGDLARLAESLDVVQALGASTIHVDVMDGHFRPQISVGQPVVRSVRKATHLMLDVHLMIERPERYFEDFVKAGADSLTFHIEATHNVTLAINSARKLGTRVGLALSPATRVETCCDVLENLDYVLVETGIETFMPRSLGRVAALAKARQDRALIFSIAAEGGIGAKEADDLLAAGADILVAGSAIFDKSERGDAMRALVRKLSGSSLVAGRDTKSEVH
jgi:ribulose-phosphate 3-epimerase